MEELQIQLLGGLQVFSGAGQPIALAARKAQALLAYLATRPGRAQPRGKVVALLWEESGEVQARASLRQTLTVLRKAFDLADEGAIASAGDAIALNLDPARIDIARFERLVEDGSLDALERAAALYQGDFLEGFNPKAPAFDEWLTAERQRLRERAVDALSKLLAHYMAAGASERAVEMALRLLSLDPLQESVHRSLMQLYARHGREASALRQFHICRELLQRELGAVPEPETDRLYKDIQRQRREAAKPEGRAVSEDTAGTDAEAASVALPPAGPAAQDATTLASELRPITVVFVELAEVTRAGEDGDPERLQSLSERFLAAVHAIVEAYGGSIDRHLGGSAMALFGVPTAHSNDGERALRAAWQILNAARHLGDADERALGAHIGIAGGRLLVTHGGPSSGRAFTLTGEAIHVAGRLAAAARADEILVSDATFQAVSHLAEPAVRRDVPLARSSAALAAWQVGGLRGRRVAPARSRFIGRDAELRQFSSAAEACRDTGHGLTLYLRGEAGIGKTRLVEEFQRLASGQGFVCHAGLVLDFGGGEQDAMREIAASLLGIAAEGEAPARTAIESAVSQGLLDRERRIYVYDLLRLPQPPELRAIYDAMDNAGRNRGKCESLAALVQRRSERQPNLLVIEDVHWADPSTLAQAAALAAVVPDCAAILVMTARTEADPLNAAWRSAAGRNPLITMDLGPLRWREAAALAAEFAGAADPFAIRCVERSGGNPLFLEQLLRGGNRPDASGLPGSVQSVVLARMDRLEGRERQALRVASVLGQRFSLAGLRHLLGSAEYDCDGLLESGLLRMAGDDFLFAHALVQEGVYSSLPPSEQRDLHRRAAQWFADKDPILRAEHLDRARDPAAPQAYLEAASREAADYRYDRALQLAERGLALGGEGAVHFALTCCRGEVQHDLGAVADARRAFEAALVMARDDGERCRAWLGIAAVKRITDDLTGALADVEKVEEAATRLRLIAEAARAHFLHGNLLFPKADVEGCLREHRLSLELARQAGSAELEAGALGGLGDAEYVRGHMLSAHERFRRCLELCQRHGFGRIEVANRPMAAFMRWFAGETAGALEDALAAIELAARVGHPRAEAIAHHAAYFCRHSLADFAGAWEHAETALTLARRLGARRFEAEALGFRGELHRLAGRPGAARADLGAALAISRQTGMAYMGPLLLGLMALAAEARALRDAALAEGEALLAAGSVSHNHLLFRKDAIDACLAAGDWDDAVRHAAALEAFARQEPLPWTAFFAARGRALAACGQGKTGDSLTRELRRLCAEGETLGLQIAVPSIRLALGANGGETPTEAATTFHESR